MTNFNPRAPQGARPRLLVDCADPALISIHALRKERDVAFHVVDAVRHISIHALRKERDHLRVRRSHHTHNFNPRAPQGARQRLCLMQTTHRLFQSTRSAGSATHLIPPIGVGDEISIHALRRERDSKSGHKRSLLRCIHNDYSPHMCFFLMFTSTNLIQLDF